MKRFLVLLVGLFLLASSAWAEDTVLSTTSSDSDSAILTTDVELWGILVATDLSNDATVDLYNSATNTGTIQFKFQVPGTDDYGFLSFSKGVFFDDGVYLDITTSGSATAFLYYKHR